MKSLDTFRSLVENYFMYHTEKYHTFDTHKV
jgi:hypothetical protein